MLNVLVIERVVSWEHGSVGGLLSHGCEPQHLHELLKRKKKMLKFPIEFASCSLRS